MLRKFKRFIKFLFYETDTFFMKRILLLGNGAREHCIAETLKRSLQPCELGVFASAANPGIKALTQSYRIGKLMDFESLRVFASAFKPHFAFIGPDDPIGAGAADVLLDLGIPSVAPLKAQAQLESSKSFTRRLLNKYDIPGNPLFRVFESEQGLEAFMKELGEFVVKADGLMGGKGVKVFGEHLHSIEEALMLAQACLKRDGRVVVEEKLLGQEFSLMSFVDGPHVLDMPVVQDNKRAFEGDLGPNTGGMGTISNTDHSLPFLEAEDVKQAHAITVKVTDALHQETGGYFKGVMYGGFIAVRDGVRLIEYNARFGDPEVMNVLSLLKTDFITVCEAIITSGLDQLNLEFEKKATVLKYIVPQGYPEDPVKNQKISLGLLPPGVEMFYGSVDAREDGLYLLGSRALALLGKADTLEEAERLVEKATNTVQGPVFHRHDIGTLTLISQRVEQMKKLRG